MRSLARHFAEAIQTEPVPQERATGFQIVACHPAMEGFSDQLIQALPDRVVTLVQWPAAVSQESQQQDLHDQTEDLSQQYQDLLALLNPKEPQHNVQVFLLDEAGMVSGHAGSAAALKALVKSSMTGSHKVVAALSKSWKAPAKAALESVDQMLVQGQTCVLRSYLSANGVVACESFEELRDTLAAL